MTNFVDDASAGPSDTLRYEVLVHPALPQREGLVDAEGRRRTWSPISTTLLIGPTEVVVVDPGMTFGHARVVGDRVAALGRRLAAVYATHGHGDHWFASGPLQERFDDVTVFATPGTIGMMRRNADGRSSRYDAMFPGQIPPSLVTAVPVPAAGLVLDGELLIPVEVGHTDTDDTTVLHVPSIGLVVAGDAVYNHVHQMLAEAGDGGLEAWLAGLDVISALQPAAVVAGHKDASRPDSPDTVEHTRRYLLDAAELLETTTTAREFYDAMMNRYATRLNPGALWRSASALKP